MARELHIPDEFSRLSKLTSLSISLRGLPGEDHRRAQPGAVPSRSVSGLSALTSLTSLSVSRGAVELGELKCITGLRELSLRCVGLERLAQGGSVRELFQVRL